MAWGASGDGNGRLPNITVSTTSLVGMTMGFLAVLKGSWDLVTRVIIRVTILITTSNPN